MGCYHRLGGALVATLVLLSCFSGAALAADIVLQTGGNGTNGTNVANGTNGSAADNQTTPNGSTNQSTNGSSNNSSNPECDVETTGATASNPYAGTADVCPDGSDGSEYGGPTENATNGGGGILAQMVRGAANGLATGIEGFVNAFNDMFIGFSTPGTLDEPSTLLEPSNSWWGTFFQLFVVQSFIAAIAYVFWFLRSFSLSPHEQRVRVERIQYAMLIHLVGWAILPIAIHISNEAALALAPSGTEFLSTPGNVGRLSLGAFLGSILIATNIGVVAFGTIVSFGIWAAPLLCYGVWPTGCMLYPAKSRFVQAIPYIMFAATVGLLLLRPIQAALLRGVFELPIAPLTDGQTAVGTLVLTLITLLVVFYWLPFKALGRIVSVAVLSRLTAATDRFESEFNDRRPSRDEITSGLRDRYNRVMTDGGTSQANDSGAEARNTNNSYRVGGATSLRSDADRTAQRGRSTSGVDASGTDSDSSSNDARDRGWSWDDITDPNRMGPGRSAKSHRQREIDRNYDR